MASLAALSSNNNEPGTSQSHAEQPASRPTGLKLVLPPLKAGKLVKGIKRSSTGTGPSFIWDSEVKKPPRPVKLKPLKEVLARLISLIKRKDDYAFFLTPVDTSNVPGYTDVVKRPMDLGTMTTKVSKGKYRSLEEFASDFRLVTGNAKAFNPPETIYYTEADRIEAFGLDHISKAAATVIEYETDWNIEIEQDDENTSLNVDEYDGDAPTPMDVDGGFAAASPAPSASQAQPTKRGARGPYKKTIGNLTTDNIDAEGCLPGSKDGLGAFPPGSDWAKLMLALKRKNKRYRTKKERLRIEREGPPYRTDGSLDYSEIEDPFSVLSVFAPDPPFRPQLTPIYPRETTLNSLPAPTSIPAPTYPPSIDIQSNTKSPKRRHWTINRNALTRANKTKEKDDDDDVPAWQVPREAHAVDFGAFAGLCGELGMRGLGSEEPFFDAIREDVDVTMAVEGQSHKSYWTRKRAADAQDYIRDVVYGGVDGLAYVKSLAEFISPPLISAKEEPVEPSCTGLGMPLAEYVENYIVDPLTDGFHNVLRTTAQYLIDPSSTLPLPAAIASQVDSAVHNHPSVSHTLTQLKQVTSEAIDMAALIRLPAELFLSESEWAGARWKEERVKKAEGDDAQAMTSDESDGQGASEYLAFAIKSHQEAQAKATGNSTAGFAQDEPGVLQYVLNYVADVIAELEARRQDGTWQVKEESKDKESEEDARLRDLRLNLLALAKRAPLDKIQRLPAELVPEHIRHFVPTVGAPLSL